jgi:large subunit ribosomal protein L4
MELDVHDTAGAKVGTIALDETVWGIEPNIAVMHQALLRQQANARLGTHDTKTRAEVRGGGRKPWRQKGTGRARQGSIVAPHWRHGGVALGPHPRDLGHAMPKKMRRAAIFSALSAKLADGELIVIDSLGLESISTKTAAAFLKEMSPTRKTLVILESVDDTAVKSLRNIEGVTIRVAPAFSVRDVVDGGTVLLTRAAVEKIEATWNAGTGSDTEEGA